MMPYMCRVVGGRIQVYQMRQSVLPRAWCFVSYERGCVAIDDSPTRAISQALRAFHKGKEQRGLSPESPVTTRRNAA